MLPDAKARLRERAIKAIAIMDERGLPVPGSGKMALWRLEWNEIRATLSAVVEAAHAE